jgi:hypothetical protein
VPSNSSVNWDADTKRRGSFLNHRDNGGGLGHADNLAGLAGAGVGAALAATASMSAGVRAREMAFVNGDREFAARFVIHERTVNQERSAN